VIGRKAHGGGKSEQTPRRKRDFACLRHALCTSTAESSCAANSPPPEHQIEELARKYGTTVDKVKEVIKRTRSRIQTAVDKQSLRHDDQRGDDEQGD
jgi:hypothetical protein